MALYDVDISHLFCTDKPTNGHLRYADLKYTVEHTDVYTPPVVKPENGHLRVVQNPASFYACKELGRKRITCDVPSEFEKLLTEHYPLVPHAPSKEIVNIFFYDVLLGPFPEISDIIERTNKAHEGKAITQVRLHPEMGGVEIHFNADAPNQFCLLNNILGLYFALSERLGPMRSINGKRFTFSKA